MGSVVLARLLECSSVAPAYARARALIWDASVMRRSLSSCEQTCAGHSWESASGKAKSADADVRDQVKEEKERAVETGC
jgi:hypothetical protein